MLHPLFRPAAVAAALSCASAASAQVWVPPEVSTQFLGAARFERVPPDEVQTGDASALAALQYALQQKGGVQRQDVAEIRVTVRGDWFFSAEESAKEQAASIGANYLMLQRSFGDERYPDSERIYLATRLQRIDGLASYTRPRGDVETPRRAPVPAAREPWMPAAAGPPPAAPAPAPAEAEEKPAGAALEWIWMDHDFILSHRLSLELSGLSAQAWGELEEVVRRHFPKAQHAALLKHRSAGARVVVDLRRRALWAL
jgi:hypothetical protein